MSYNYLEEMKTDIKDYIASNVNYLDYESIYDLQEKLQDVLLNSDSITGNRSGSYTFSKYKAKEYVIENIDLLQEACEEFAIESSEVGYKFLEEDFEWMDVIIRCYLLGNAISEVLEEIKDDFYDSQEEENMVIHLFTLRK